jgi:hypothetical protein
MRRFGRFLAVLGLLLGGAAALALALPIHITGISWLIAAGLVKLTFASSLGLIAGGAVFQRIGKRNEERARLSARDRP